MCIRDSYIDNAILSEYTLNKERTSIGRRPTNDIHIDNLAVSGEHAMIVKMGKDYYVEDVGSTNGTTVNGEEIQKHLLQHADLIELGKHQLKFINEEVLSHLGTEQSEAAGFEKTVMMRPSGAHATEQKTMQGLLEQQPQVAAPANVEPVSPTEAAMSATAAPFNSPIGKIQVLNGGSVGREMVLNKALTTLGKVGVQVAVITKRPSGYFITHVEGKTFPLVNNTSTGAQAFALKDHDVIELAGVKMEFYLS